MLEESSKLTCEASFTDTLVGVRFIDAHGSIMAGIGLAKVPFHFAVDAVVAAETVALIAVELIHALAAI